LDGDLVLGVLRHAGCPVIVAAQDPADAITATAPKRIGVAWDRGEEAHEALVVAARVAELAGGNVHVVHVIEPAAALVLPPGDPQIGHELTKTRHRECDAAIRAAAHAVNPELEVQIDLRDGKVSKQIEAATKDLDVLIVGSHRKGLLKRVTVGSVSEHLVHHNHCPVVVVPRGVTAGAAV
ncbi:MAG: universal stress protein, partial [Solirubrobacteraceae bacterium]|nr:universal stress protein [Solirubrobacteraceae bacterium]